jgi:hypothetical protein
LCDPDGLAKALEEACEQLLVRGKMLKTESDLEKKKRLAKEFAEKEVIIQKRAIKEGKRKAVESGSPKKRAAVERVSPRKRAAVERGTPKKRK